MGWFKRRVTIDPALLERIQEHVEREGFSSIEEFVHHCITKELGTSGSADDSPVQQRLRGLGYID